uniref:Uncharacterized protein n=1 Tax=Oncorhynchus mykiss TaxID=8022 RepID=A0A8C7P6T1_ONCMY
MHVFLSPTLKLKINIWGAVNAEVNTFTQTERQSVTLHTGLTGLQADKIFWFFGPVIPNTSIVESQVIRGENFTEFKGRFPDRLQLDRETGSHPLQLWSLSAKHLHTKHLRNSTLLSMVSVGLSNLRSKGSCSVVCSVENQIERILSCSPDLSTNLSLPLEIKLQDNNIYSCVPANPVSNQTTKLNIETLCLHCHLNVFSSRFQP